MQIDAPKGNHTRPTTDRIKESLFNIINHLIDGANVLDLFSGSGSLGIEALSRGADSAIFCDKAGEAISLIKKNVSHCKLESKAQIYHCDYLRGISKCSEMGVDLVFLDPPYGTGLLQTAISEIVSARILTNDAIIVAEHPSSETFADTLARAGLGVVRLEKYGDISISFIKAVDGA